MLEDDQRTLAEVALAILGRRGFALAGSGAIREHGLTTRPTEDIDLFSSSQDSEHRFQESVDILVAGLKNHGYIG